MLTAVRVWIWNGFHLNFAECEKYLLDNWITKFGCAVRIHSDQGKEFCNNIWNQLCDRLQITKTVTPAYNPNSNLIERFHRTLNTIMRTHLAREDAGWARFLPMATFAFNSGDHCHHVCDASRRRRSSRAAAQQQQLGSSFSRCCSYSRRRSCRKLQFQQQ